MLEEIDWLNDVQWKNIEKMKALLKKAYPGARIKVDIDYEFYQEGPDGVYDRIDFEVWDDGQKIWDHRFYDFTYYAAHTEYDPAWERMTIVKK